MTVKLGDLPDRACFRIKSEPNWVLMREPRPLGKEEDVRVTVVGVIHPDGHFCYTGRSWESIYNREIEVSPIKVDLQ